MQSCITKKLFIIVSFFAAVSYFYYAVPVNAAVAPSIAGRVRNSVTGAGIAGVWVGMQTTANHDMVPCLQAAAIRYEKTDSSGNFYFDGVMPYSKNADTTCTDPRLGKPIDTNLDGVNDTVQIARQMVECYTETSDPLYPQKICSYDFGCMMTPMSIKVIKPVSWNGYFTSVNNIAYDNAQTATTIQAGTISYIPATNSISGIVFIDSDGDGLKDSSEIGYSRATITYSGAASGSYLADIDGNYVIGNIPNGTYTVSVTMPTGYGATTPAAQTVTVSPDKTINFGIAPIYTLSGNLFKDFNINGMKDNGETNYTGVPTITVNRGTLTTRADGSYTISNLIPGTVTLSLTSLPTGYKITSPLNGPPPTYQVTVGPGCTTNGAKGASCN